MTRPTSNGSAPNMTESNLLKKVSVDANEPNTTPAAAGGRGLAITTIESPKTGAGSHALGVSLFGMGFGG